jgi:flagellar assembly factor FliW
MVTQNATAEQTEQPPPGTDVPDAQPAIRTEGEQAIIETRFGTLTFNRDKALHMPRGLLGYADNHEFGLTALPDTDLDQFMLLQSLSTAELSFIVAPLNRDGETLEEKDIEAACSTLSISAQQAAVLLIVSTRRIGEVTQISVNLRAPVIVDGQSNRAWQQVLANSRYPVRQVIGSVKHD